MNRTQEQWDKRQNNDHSLLSPLKQLFAYERLTVTSGATATVRFNVSAVLLAEYEESSGDLVSEAANVNLMFSHGEESAISLMAQIAGDTVVVEQFPSSH